MYINWKALLSFGFAFWTVMCATDLLGESTWRRCSPYVDDALKDQSQNLLKTQQEETSETLTIMKQKTNWPVLLWNTCAFLCTLLFFSALKSMSWVFWRIFKIYNVFRNRKVITNRFLNAKTAEGANLQDNNGSTQSNCQILFKNQMFISTQQESSYLKELEELKKEKNELAQELLIAKKENMTNRQQIEEYKLETLMMKEKLVRTADSLKENLRYKDFANANQEIIARKAHSLEIHLKEISKDRELLRNKLSNLEKSYSKLTDRLKHYEKDESETGAELIPEKDTSKSSETQERESSEVSKGDADCNYQRKWENNVENLKKELKANSKISVDLEESSKENDSDVFHESSSDSKKTNIDLIKQNILNYSAYKAQMLKPRFKLNSFKRLYTSADTTGSSSDDAGGSCHRIISSTIEFQNFLKTLNSKSVDDVKCIRNLR